MSQVTELESLIEARRRSAGRQRRHGAPTQPVDVRRVATLIAVAVVAALVTVALWPPSKPAAPSTVTSTEDRWRERLETLYEARSAAFAQGSGELLHEVYTRDSRQLRADLDTIQSLQAQDRHVVGFAPELLEVVSVTTEHDGVRVVVRDELAPFSIVDATGTEMAVTGRPAAAVTVQLQQVADRWLIADITRATV